jgi:predicted 3-demethylubiquinone-9 3-methyltransferase (glyoxalase superfamily)
MPQRITPFLWFDSNAQEAADYYVSIFPNSEITEVSRYGEAGPRVAGSVMVVSFRLDGQEFSALNGGPEFTFNEAVSFVIECANQDVVDYYWTKLTDEGEPGPCGWLKDKFGVSWQVNPTVLTQMLQDEDRERADRVMQAMLQMGKIDIAKLEEAYAQK